LSCTSGSTHSAFLACVAHTFYPVWWFR
jgi:hypothetical protein